MRCEVCGHKIHSRPIRAIIEGAKLTVCIECSKHGRTIRNEEAKLGQKAPKKSLTPIKFAQKKKTVQAKVEITQEVVEEYYAKIRQAREKRGLSHEALGKRINEKASVLSKLETGKMTPNNMLVTKLERALKIKLLVPIKEEKISHMFPKSSNREPTLGDLIRLNKKGGEEPTERKQS
ncbi:MAG: multiprotein bridging factor aMBF1 [Candidatus Bathyarchaeota archaeon]|nr:multiprotein bridging factor aMBF1 [Candidatus Bathyarchaeota archaeon]